MTVASCVREKQLSEGRFIVRFNRVCKRKTFLIFGLLACLGLASSGKGADSLSVEDILAGIRFERQRLSSGVFTFRCTESLEFSNGNVQEYPMESRGAFSSAEPLWLHLFKGHDFLGYTPELEKSQIREAPITWALCYRPDLNFHMREEPLYPPRLYLTFPAKKQVSGMGGRSRLLDPRVFGLVPAKARGGYMLDSALESFERRVTSTEFTATGLGKGIYKLELEIFVPQGEGVEFVSVDSYLVDTKRGFTIRKCLSEQFFGDAKGKRVPIEEFFASRPASEYLDKHFPSAYRVNKLVDEEISWKEVDTIWVPTSIKSAFTDVHPVEPQPEGSSEMTFVSHVLRLEGSFDWQSVGQELEPDIFDYRYLDVSPNTVVFDYRLPDKPYIGILGRMNDKRQAESSWTRLYIASVAVIVLGCGAFYIYRRRYAR